jgi:thioredoxin reductase (NADPH)
MSSIPVPDEMTHYSSRRRDQVDQLAFPVLSEHLVNLLRSGGEELRPEPGELLWDAGDPYDLYLVLAGRCSWSIAGKFLPAPIELC